MTSRGASKASARLSSWIYTTRLQKGGALFDDMRQLVRTWGDAPTKELRAAAVRANNLNKKTRTRLADIHGRTFLPRFVDGPIPPMHGNWFVR